jgi:hypothetical protein
VTTDPDDLYDDAVICKIEIAVRRNGAMSVAGAINDLADAIAMLDNAKDAVRRHHDRNRIENGGLIIPGRDTGLLT